MKGQVNWSEFVSGSTGNNLKLELAHKRLTCFFIHCSPSFCSCRGSVVDEELKSHPRAEEEKESDRNHDRSQQAVVKQAFHFTVPTSITLFTQ